MNLKEAKRKRREHRQAIAREYRLAETSSKENLIAAVKAYHLKAVELHKALMDARDLIACIWVAAEIGGVTQYAADPPDADTCRSIVEDINKILKPPPRVIPTESIPAQVRLQATLDDMKARGEFPENTEGRAI